VAARFRRCQSQNKVQLKSWDTSTLNCNPHLLFFDYISGCWVTRNDTEFSYRISMTWKDIPANSDAEYMCSAYRKEDDMKETLVEDIRVHSK